MMTATTTQVFLGKNEVAQALGLHHQTVYALERNGELLEPDIVIGVGMTSNGQRFNGYSRDRVIQFGKETGRLNKEGQPWTRGGGMTPTSRPVPTDERGLRPAWWYADPAYYLSRSDLTVVWGVKPITVNTRAQRGRMPDADVVINTTMPRGATYGYHPEAIVRRSQQMGIPVVVDPGPYHARAAQQ